MFQSAFYACISTDERIEGNHDLQFELEYFIKPRSEHPPAHVRISRRAVERRKLILVIQQKVGRKWKNCELSSPDTLALLPKKVIGYTSGDNETLSLPFLISRSGYADEVSRVALYENTRDRIVPDTRLMLIDYGTNLEVLVANLLMEDEMQRHELLAHARLQDLHSFRCIIQLARKPGPQRTDSGRKGIQLTSELEEYLSNLEKCSTCYFVDEKTETYTFDFWVNEDTRKAFKTFWDNTLQLYSAFHKLAMLNDLVIPKKSRDRFKKNTRARRFASRLPEPQDEDKVFRFERVSFIQDSGENVVDYVSLSDGEHQQAQLLGTFCMLSFSGVLFVLDEPESHFNPQWRVKFISRLRDLHTANGSRGSESEASMQECLMTTHSPFLPSDMHREKVFIFSKDDDGKVRVENPNIETFGSTFDTIVEACFGVKPPISDLSMEEIDRLKQTDDPEEIRAGMERLGYSVEKAVIASRLQQMTEEE